MILSLRQYAEHRKARGLRGGSLRAVQKALETDRIHAAPGGGIDPEPADREWASNTDGMKAHDAITAAAAQGAPEEAPPQPAALHSSAISEPEGLRARTTGDHAMATQQPALDLAPPAGSLASAQRDLVGLKAEKAELELQRLRGEVISVEEVEATVGGLIAAAQARLLVVAHKVGEEVARTTDPVMCRHIIDHAIREALEELSQYKVAP